MLEEELDFWKVLEIGSAENPSNMMNKMQNIFNKEPDNINQEILDKWKTLQPFNLVKAIQMENLTFNNLGDVSTNKDCKPILFRQKPGACIGQTNMPANKSGYCRAIYKDGVFEGQYENGQLNGFGRVISRQGWYMGYFKDAAFNGRGTFTFWNGSQKKGYWKDNEIIKTDMPMFGGL